VVANRKLRRVMGLKLTPRGLGLQSTAKRFACLIFACHHHPRDVGYTARRAQQENPNVENRSLLNGQDGCNFRRR